MESRVLLAIQRGIWHCTTARDRERQFDQGTSEPLVRVQILLPTPKYPCKIRAKATHHENSIPARVKYFYIFCDLQVRFSIRKFREICVKNVGGYEFATKMPRVFASD